MALCTILHKEGVVGIYILKAFFQYCLICSGIQSRWTSNEDFADITFYGSPYKNGFITESNIFHSIQGLKKVYLIAGISEDQMGTGLTQNI